MKADVDPFFKVHTRACVRQLKTYHGNTGTLPPPPRVIVLQTRVDFTHLFAHVNTYSEQKCLKTNQRKSCRRRTAAGRGRTGIWRMEKK